MMLLTTQQAEKCPEMFFFFILQMDSFYSLQFHYTCTSVYSVYSIIIWLNCTRLQLVCCLGPYKNIHYLNSVLLYFTTPSIILPSLYLSLTPMGSLEALVYHVFGLWEETKVPRERYGENMPSLWPMSYFTLTVSHSSLLHIVTSLKYLEHMNGSEMHRLSQWKQSFVMSTVR